MLASVGRKRINHDLMAARFAAGTFERIDAVLQKEETRTDLIRAAVEREIALRAQAKKRPRQKSK